MPVPGSIPLGASNYNQGPYSDIERQSRHNRDEAEAELSLLKTKRFGNLLSSQKAGSVDGEFINKQILNQYYEFPNPEEFVPEGDEGMTLNRRDLKAGEVLVDEQVKDMLKSQKDLADREASSRNQVNVISEDQERALYEDAIAQDIEARRNAYDFARSKQLDDIKNVLDKSNKLFGVERLTDKFINSRTKGQLNKMFINAGNDPDKVSKLSVAQMKRILNVEKTKQKRKIDSLKLIPFADNKNYTPFTPSVSTSSTTIPNAPALVSALDLAVQAAKKRLKQSGSVPSAPAMSNALDLAVQAAKKRLKPSGPVLIPNTVDVSASLTPTIIPTSLVDMTAALAPSGSSGTYNRALAISQLQANRYPIIAARNKGMVSASRFNNASDEELKIMLSMNPKDYKSSGKGLRRMMCGRGIPRSEDYNKNMLTILQGEVRSGNNAPAVKARIKRITARL